MGLFSKIRGEFIDIIEWTDDSNDTMVWRFPRYQNEIKMGAKLTVRESQVAIFVNEGVIADVFQPGMHELKTQNMPILTTLKGWKYGFDSPFLAEVYFISTKQFTNQKWGTKNPVMLRDPEFGPIRIRAFGNFALRIQDPKRFLTEIAGTNAHFTTEEVSEQLRNLVVTRFTDALAESKIPVLDLASNYDELSAFVATKINPEFEELGVGITKFLIENISLPPEVETALDKRSSMGIIGNLGAYTQFQAANAMEKAAESGDSSMGAGVGMGMGMGMANQMGNMFQSANGNQQAGAGTPPPLPGLSYHMAVNGVQTGPHQEQQLRHMIASGTLTRESLVWKEGMTAWTAAGEVPELARLFTAVPPPLPPM